jgi:hypothetical protein
MTRDAELACNLVIRAQDEESQATLDSDADSHEDIGHLESGDLDSDVFVYKGVTFCLY